MFQVLIVGCGNIAGRFDAARSSNDLPVTHAAALRRHGGFAIKACIDPDASTRIAFADRWGVECHADSVAALAPSRGEYDMVCICSPTHLHASHLEQVLAIGPRLIFCEKPVTPTLAETTHWVERLAEARVLFAVNHSRRWDPEVVRFCSELRSGRWGAVRAITGIYNKGVLNNGAHMIDLLSMLIGDVRPIFAGRPVWDFWQDDPSVPAMLEGGSGIPVQLNIAHASDCAIFEVHIITSKGVVTMEDGGQAWRIRPIVESTTFKGYRTLAAGERSVGKYAFAMSGAVENLYDALQGVSPIACTGEMAASAQAVCEALRFMALSDCVSDTA